MEPLTRAELESKVTKVFLNDDAVGLKRLFDEGLIFSDFETQRGFSLLTVAASCPLKRGSNEHIVAYLLSRPDIDIEKPSSSGRTPVLYAARSGQVETLKKLLKSGKGACPNTANPDGDNPIFAACNRPDRENVIDVLLNDPRTSVDPHPIKDPLAAAIAGGHLTYVKKLANHRGIDLTSPRRMQIYRPHDRQESILIFPVERKLRPEGADIFVLNGSLLDFAHMIEEKYGHNGIAEYLAGRIEQLNRERLEQRRSPISSHQESSRISGHSVRSASRSSRELELCEPLLGDYYQSLYDETLHSDTQSGYSSDSQSTTSENGRRGSVDSGNSTSSAMKIMRALTEMKVVTPVQQSKPVAHLLEEKEINYITAHNMMIDTLKHWPMDNTHNSHESRPKIFTTTLDPVVRAFNAEPTNQRKFQTMVDAFLAINTSVLPDNQNTRDFQRLRDIILHAAGKEHEYLQIQTQLSTKVNDKPHTTLTQPSSSRPLISFAPFFKAALKQTSPAEERASKNQAPPTPNMASSSE